MTTEETLKKLCRLQQELLRALINSHPRLHSDIHHCLDDQWERIQYLLDRANELSLEL